MSALESLNNYLRAVERRVRVRLLSGGLGLVGFSALAATVLLVLMANYFAFSALSVLVARILLVLTVALAAGLGVILPLLRLNRGRAAGRAEEAFPELEQRLLTIAEAPERSEPQPFLELMAEDALPLIERAEPGRVVKAGQIGALAAAAVASTGALVWLILAGPGFLGYGSSLLWSGTPRRGDQPFYDILVSPGNKTVRRGGDLLVTAAPSGFQPPSARLFARYESASKWEEASLQPQGGGAGFEFLFAGLPESVEYYVEAGGIRSQRFRLTVVDVPRVERIRVTYRYPRWLGRADEVEENGGDLRAVEGTEADLVVETDKPLQNGRLVLGDAGEVALESESATSYRGTVAIRQDGLYHIAAMEQDERVRLTEDYFIEARPENAPSVRIRRPGRDFRASPIEEVTVRVEGEDDFGLQELTLRYSVNGGPERSVALLDRKGRDQVEGGTILYLEDEKLVPGDLVSMYAVARDARHTAQTDIFFIEAQPFEREYSQSQQAGGMGTGGDLDENTISARQKEIIAATWNTVKDTARSREQLREDAGLLSDVQGKLKDQAESLARRMRARQLSMANEEFELFAQNMEAAARSMTEAVNQLRTQSWRAALPPEQRALQHLLRAEAVFRQIQVARGSRGAGGGGNMGRDLENLFDLELDTEKNQYETGQQASLASQQAREVDEALQKLAELARRQQELAEQQREDQQAFQQRWQQEMLRREAEELQRRMEQLARRTNPLQRGDASSSGQSSGSSPTGGSSGGGAQDERLRQSLERLRLATEDMRRAGSSQGNPNQRDVDSRRAAERLKEATDMLGRMRRQESAGQLSDLAERAERLAEQQQEFADKLRELYKGHRAVSGQRGPSLEDPPPPDPQAVRRLAEEKQQMAEELRRLEEDMQAAVRNLAAGQKSASSQLREAVGEMQQSELGLRMKYLAEWIRRGLGAYAWMREAPVTEGLNRLAEQTRNAQRAAGGEEQGRPGESLERALARVERLRGELERLVRGNARGAEAGGQQRQESTGDPSGEPSGGDQRGRRGLQPGGDQPGSPRAGARDADEAPGSPQYGGEGSGRTYSAMNAGDRDANLPPRPLSPEGFRAMERAYREGLSDLSQLRQSVRGDQESADELGSLIRAMQRLDPSRFRGNPALVEALRSQVLPGIEQLELRLRRQVEGDAAGQVKSVLSRPVPPGYADAVAEYYRRLSEGR